MKLKILYSILFSSALLALTLFWLLKPSPLTFKISAFKNLPGWNKTDVQGSLRTFQVSCKAFLKMAPEQAVGSQKIPMQAADWQPACKAAMALQAVNNQT